jgi:uncharacterized membrane protein
VSTDRKLATAIVAVAVLGLGVAGYLSYTKLFGGTVQCIAGHGCQIVQKSSYATFAGVPVPYIGFLGWIGILLSLLVPGDIGRGITALMTVFGFFFTLYLTYLEIWVIEAICQWCVANGVLMSIAAVLAVWRLLVYTPPMPLSAEPATDQNE